MFNEALYSEMYYKFGTSDLYCVNTIHTRLMYLAKDRLMTRIMMSLLALSCVCTRITRNCIFSFVRITLLQMSLFIKRFLYTNSNISNLKIMVY